MIKHLTASAVILNGDEVLLIQHKKGTTGTNWIYPGGHVKRGEDPAEAVLREISEEVGITVELVTEVRFTHPKVKPVPAPFTILDIPVRDKKIGPHRHIDFVYVARAVTTTVVAAPDEVSDYRWVPVSEVATMGVPVELPSLIAAAARWAEERPVSPADA